MDNLYKIIGKKIIINVRGRVCETPDELLSSGLFKEVVKQCLRDLKDRDALLISLFRDEPTSDEDIAHRLTEIFKLLCKLSLEQTASAFRGKETLLRHPLLLAEFVEYLYNYWRGFNRYVICRLRSD